MSVKNSGKITAHLQCANNVRTQLV